jgi:hypothetical protein
VQGGRGKSQKSKGGKGTRWQGAGCRVKAPRIANHLPFYPLPCTFTTVVFNRCAP